MGHDVWVVSGALAVALRLSRVAGSAPLRLWASGATLHARVSNAHAVYGIVLVISLNVIVISGLLVDIKHNYNNSVRMIRGGTNFDFLLWLINMTITNNLSILGALSGRTRMKRMVHFFDYVRKENLGVHENKDKVKREKKRVAICILSLTLLLALMVYDFVCSIETAAALKKELLVAYLYGAHYMCNYIAIILAVQIIFIIYGIQAILESVNEDLERILSNVNETRPLDNADKDSLRRGATLYNLVCNIVNQFNKVDGGLMLLMFSSFNVFLVFTADSLHDTITAFANGDTELSNVLRGAAWCIVHIAGMVFFMEPCHQIHQEVSKLHVLLTNLMLSTQRLGERGAMCTDILYKEMFLEKPTFSPLGVCTLTRSLFSNVLSALTTCLVIVVQYRMDGASDVDESE